jgi:hypothetical protein
MRRMPVGTMLMVVWLAAIVASFLLFQPPVAPGEARALALTLVDFAAVAAMILLSGAVGTLVMPDLRLPDLLREILYALFGLGLISLLILVAGFLGVLPPRWLAWLITIILIAVMYRQAWAWLLHMRDALGLVLTHPASRVTWWLRTITLFLLGCGLVVAVAPPIGWDALTYHIGAPQTYINAGRIIAFPENHFLGFPQLVEMLNLWVMILGRPNAAAVLHWAFGCSVIAMLIGLSRSLRRPDAGWLAAVILLSGFTFWLEFAWSYNDLASAAYILAAVVVLLNISAPGAQSHREMFIWAGIFTGFAMGTKYTAAGSTLGVALLSIWISRRQPIAALMRNLALVAGAAAIVFLPWLIKNALLYQNPIAPFGTGTVAFDALDQWYYVRPGTGRSFRELLILPLQATVFGKQGTSPFDATIGPLMLGLIPAAFVNWRSRSKEDREHLLALALFVIPPYLTWLIGIATTAFLLQPRLLFTIFPELAMIAALGLDGLAHSSRLNPLIRFAQAIVLIIAAASALTVGVYVVQTGAVQMITGAKSEDQYLSERLGDYYSAMQAINELPADARVLTLWEPRTFFCSERCTPDSMIDQWWHDREVYGDPDVILDRWQEQGITHILIFETGMQYLYTEEQYDPLTDQDIEALDDLREMLTPVWNESGWYTLYQIDGE